jgi:hypothetical protein
MKNMAKKLPSKKPAAATAARLSDIPKTGMALSIPNYKLMVVGFAVIVLGFWLMSGGKSADPNVFNGAELYGFRRITLSTIVVLLGFFFEIYAIMYRPKPQKS